MNGIEVKNLTVQMEGFTLDNVSIDVPAGVVMGLIGRNGAGKSTLINSIADCTEKKAGEIRINGNTVSEDRVKFFSDLAVVFDKLIYNDYFKVGKLEKLFMKIRPDFDSHFFNTYLDFFRIDRYKRISKLSFGMKKKLQLIAAMSMRPSVLILDEPTTGIDPADRSEIIYLISDFMMDEEHTVMLSTHITGDLDKIGDYITLIDDGKIVFSESKVDLQDRYRLIRTDKSILSTIDTGKLIGVHENSFGVEALTDDEKIFSRPGVTAVIPTIEEIMLHFTERRA